MTIRHQAACWIIAVLMPVAAPNSAEAQARSYYASRNDSERLSTVGVTLGQKPSDEADPGLKSGTTALLWSLFGTVIPAGVAIAAASGESNGPHSDPTPGLVFLGAVVLGPSLGHFYADRPGRALAGIGIRTLAVVGAGAGFAAAWNNDSGGGELMLVGLALGGAAVVWDIIRAPHSAQIHNDKIRQRRIAIALIPSHHEPGVRLSGRISF